MMGQGLCPSNGKNQTNNNKKIRHELVLMGLRKLKQKGSNISLLYILLEIMHKPPIAFFNFSLQSVSILSSLLSTT